MTATEKPIAPLPEAIDGESWSISQGQPRVQFGDHSMFVPMGSSDEDHFVRLHEMAHAKWTPRRKDPKKEADKIGVSWEILQACEDMRMHDCLHRSGFSPRMVGSVSLKELALTVQKAMKQPDPLPFLTLIGACTYQTQDYGRLMDAMRKLGEHAVMSTSPAEIEKAAFLAGKVDQIVCDSYNVLQSTKGKRQKFISFDGTLVTAQFLRDAIDAENRSKEEEDKQDPGLGGDEDGGAKGESLEKRQDRYAKAYARSGTRDKRGRKDKDEWAEFSIGEIPLTVPVKKALAARRNTSTDCGVVPRYMHRLAVDGRVFSRKKRTPGGTILIDASGSMEIPTEDIEKILESAPCATIAMYSGNMSNNTGQLTIIASRGHRADATAIDRRRVEAGGGNMVDGPALRWLARQQEPRIWVSDGIVTGAHESLGLGLYAEANAVCRLGRITRIANTERTVKQFDRLAGGKRIEGDGEAKPRGSSE